MSILLNPKKYDVEFSDQKTKDIMLKTIDFFEGKGLQRLKEDDRDSRWYDDFLKFQKKEQAFSTLLTAEGYGEADSRFDLTRVCAYSELLAFYDLAHQYSYQVSILGLAPIWMGNNEEIKNKTAEALKEGAIFGFGMSEKEHGADLYSNEMKLTPLGEGKYRADGNKYYIGNANKAAIISTFGKIEGTEEYTFFTADTQHKNYKLGKEIECAGGRTAFVGEYDLIEYPITDADIISRGKQAWDDALSAVNIGKFQLGFASVGVCTHALYEAVTHASNRTLYGMKVTDFPHIKKLLTESYTRIVSMKLYALRSLDYFKSSTEADRRYLLFNPIQKMKVTTQGTKVGEMILDVVAAKAFEQTTYMEQAVRDLPMIPRLEGTTHVNMALVLKFMKNYFFENRDYPEILKRDDAVDNKSIFKQQSGKLRFVTFPDYKKAYDGIDLPNLNVFKEQIELLRGFLAKATPNEVQAKNIDYMIGIGEMFTIVVYSQLILENCKIYKVEDELVDLIFSLMVKDFSQYALTQLTNQENNEIQEKFLSMMMKKPVMDADRDKKIWKEKVSVLNGAFVMNS